MPVTSPPPGEVHVEDHLERRIRKPVDLLRCTLSCVGIVLLASGNFFPPPRIPVALFATLALGYLILLSRTFRAIVAGIPQHWLIGIQTFRILGGVFLVRYFEGQLPGSLPFPPALATF